MRNMNDAELAVGALGMAVFGLLLQRGWEPEHAQVFLLAAYADAFPGSAPPEIRMKFIPTPKEHP